jgi:Flp pilus assembly protein TadG
MVRDDRGAVATQVAIVMPAVLVLMALVIQAGLWFHARQRAEAAADRAVAAAATAEGSETAGHAAAQAFLAGAPLDDATVTVHRGPEAVEATVTGYAPKLVPGVAWQVTATVRADAERFIAEDDRR